MECRPINSLSFDEKSIQGINDVRRFRRNGQVLDKFLTAGVVGNIFVGNKPPLAAYQVSQTDWEKFQIARETIPKIVKKSIEDTAFIQMLKHPGSNPQNDFWKGVYNGCDI
ncbi:MAG: hypothetical protein CSA45_06400 [Gammaproteobacteria bacterium]|nr:MAG: hypothetical protein CSA45_06400 [Gammaproteobacteria bacterium]